VRKPKLVDLDHEQADRFVFALRRKDGPVNAIEQRGTVREAGREIDIRKVVDD
jgi:hypothetical protein